MTLVPQTAKRGIGGSKGKLGIMLSAYRSFHCKMGAVLANNAGIGGIDRAHWRASTISLDLQHPPCTGITTLALARSLTMPGASADGLERGSLGHDKWQAGAGVKTTAT